MADKTQEKQIIGRAAVISLPEIEAIDIHARIDTGARTSAIWVSQVQEENGRLAVIFFGKGSPYYTGKVWYFDAFSLGVVTPSNGLSETRYKIQLLVKIAGRRIRAHFTLADRSTQVYPVLVGRNILGGKFLVDVKRGQAIKGMEKKHLLTMEAQLDHPSTRKEQTS